MSEHTDLATRRVVLLTWIGTRDPVLRDDRGKPVKDIEGHYHPGPLISLLHSHSFRAIAPITDIELFYTIDASVGDHSGRRREIQDFFDQRVPGVGLHPHPVEHLAVTDHWAIYRCVKGELPAIQRRYGHADADYWAFLSPGTPQMHVVWFVMALAGAIPARLAQAIPPHRRRDERDWHEVTLSLDDFPDLTQRVLDDAGLAALARENVDLRSRVAHLEAEAALLRQGGTSTETITLGEGFTLYEYIAKQEEALYSRAFAAALVAGPKGVGKRTAELLGINEAACRRWLREHGYL